jgi:hypothetical protein
MKRLRSLIGRSPAVTVAAAAILLSTAGGATAASVLAKPAAPAVVVPWHNVNLINGWQPGGFGSFKVAYYLDANHVVHLRGSVRLGHASSAAFRLPPSIRPSHVLSMVIYASNAPAEINVLPNGLVIPFDQTGTDANVRDFSSFDGISYPLG